MRDLENVLRREYGNQITVSLVKPLHDEYFEASYMVCVDNVITVRADEPLKRICEEIEKMIQKLR